MVFWTKHGTPGGLAQKYISRLGIFNSFPKIKGGSHPDLGCDQIGNQTGGAHFDRQPDNHYATWVNKCRYHPLIVVSLLQSTKWFVYYMDK